MTTRREGDINPTGQTPGGVGAPAVPVPPPATTGGGGTTPVATGVPPMGPSVAPNGAVYSGGPGSSVQDFITNFSFANAAPGSAQDVFNKIKAQYGHNAAFSYALSNWNHFSSYDPTKGLYGAMAQAGVSEPDRSKLINTYSSNTKANYLGEGFGHESGGFFGSPGYNAFAKTVFDPNSAAAQQAIQTNQTNFQTQMANGGYDYMNRTQPAAPTFSTGGVGLDPSTNKPYGAPAVPVPPAGTATPKPDPKGPAVGAPGGNNLITGQPGNAPTTFNTTAGIDVSTGKPYAAPNVAVPTTTNTGTVSTTGDRTGTSFRFRNRTPISWG